MIITMIEKYRNQSGQVGVAILLTMTVLLTMGLSVASRSTEDLFLSEQQSESARVFNAAEAGIEDALSSSFDFEGNTSEGTIATISDTSVDYSVTKQNVLETRLFEGVSVKVDVDDSGVGTGLTSDNNIIIEWSKETDCVGQDPASLIVSVFYDDAGTTRARYYAYGACSRSDGFTLASDSAGNYYKDFTLPLLTGDLFVRIKTVYNDTHIRVAGDGWTLPVQAYNIRSEAKNDLGNETRAVEVNKTLDAAPAIMDYALFSGTTIVK
jgi:Tfp pilus assembly protein PilX